MQRIDGHVISVQGPVVDVRYPDADDVPNIRNIVKTSTIEGKEVILEVAEHRTGNVARCIALNSTQNIQRNAPAHTLGASIEIPDGKHLFSRIVNVLGEPIDQKGAIIADEKFPTRNFRPPVPVKREEGRRKSYEILETGIKIIDLLSPITMGSKTGILGGAGLGKTLIILEIIYQMIKKHEGTCVFTGVGERVREGNELYYELLRGDILSRIAIVFGQMNEPPGARMGAAMTGITVAETLQRKNNDVLLFVDNIFRYIQAGAEISTLLGRVSSETGYQPTLISEASEFHERIRSDQSMGGSITAIETVYVPADDITDPAVVAIFSFLDSILVLSRERIQLGLYPAIDPLLSSSANLDTDIVGQHHFNVAQEVTRILQKYNELKRIVLVVGIDELSQADRSTYERARKLQNFLTQPFFIAETYTGKKGQYVTIPQTLEGCEKIINGDVDQRPEQDFYMIGILE
ncbi:MAG: F0F1 ATP synthase subunit beta [Omnitrophica WOR_2 bacterium RIFCSPHIGHO2_02_FULL_50_17]|nr:MAG: F0F1 ATP synthase subunit beta [Omnitrophica WOR_2 bacterium RIFCSPHIGHO2_02_FULL_50_17]